MNLSRVPAKARRLVAVAMVAAAITIPPILLFGREVRRVNLNRELIQAIKAGEFDRAEALLKQGADGTANEADVHHATFGEAIQHLMHAFTHKPAGVHFESEGSRSALLCYYESARPTGTSADIGFPPEHLAVNLLDAGASPYSCERNGPSILDYACQNHHHLVVKRLASLGADVNETGTVGTMRPLMLADTQDSQVLLDHHADIDAGGYRGETALYGADGSKAELLLSRGANVELANTNGFTPLLNACNHGLDDIVMKMLAHHASVHKRSKSGVSAILGAAGKCKLETVLALVHSGANPLDRTLSGSTFLIIAAGNKDERVFQWGMKQGIDVRAKTQMGYTAILRAATSGQLESVQALVRAGADVHDTDKRGYTCMNYAAGNPDSRVCQWLIKQGLDVNHVARFGVTPLSEAAFQSSLQVVKTLVHAGANTKASDADGKTVLMAALENPDDRVFAFLLTQPVDVNATDKKGETALSITVAKRDDRIQDHDSTENEDKIIALLKAHGAR